MENRLNKAIEKIEKGIALNDIEKRLLKGLFKNCTAFDQDVNVWVVKK